MYRKLSALIIGPRKTSLAIPKKISSSQTGSSTYLVPHPAIPFIPLPCLPTPLLGIAPLQALLK
jgi:hypothetical protein